MLVERRSGCGPCCRHAFSNFSIRNVCSFMVVEVSPFVISVCSIFAGGSFFSSFFVIHSSFGNDRLLLVGVNPISLWLTLVFWCLHRGSSENESATGNSLDSLCVPSYKRGVTDALSFRTIVGGSIGFPECDDVSCVWIVMLSFGFHTHLSAILHRPRVHEHVPTLLKIPVHQRWSGGQVVGKRPN